MNLKDIKIQKNNFIVTILVSVLALVSFLLIIFKIDPYQASRSVKFLFYSSFFCLTWGSVASLSGFINGYQPDSFRNHFRVGLWIALVFTALILSWKQSIYYSYSITLAGVILVILELKVLRKGVVDSIE